MPIHNNTGIGILEDALVCRQQKNPTQDGFSSISWQRRRPEIERLVGRVVRGSVALAMTQFVL